MRQELKDLKTHIYEDGSISDAEVGLLKSMFNAYGFGADEARLLLDLNNILNGTDYPEAFEKLFLEVLSGYIVQADGQIDGDRWKWFSDRLFQDGAVDGLERRLVEKVVATAKNPPDVTKLIR